LWRVIGRVEFGQLVDQVERISKNVVILWLCCTICQVNQIDRYDSRICQTSKTQRINKSINNNQRIRKSMQSVFKIE